MGDETVTTTQPITAASLAEVFFEVDAKHENAMLDDTGRYHAYAEAVLALLNASQAPQQMMAAARREAELFILEMDETKTLADNLAAFLTTFAERRGKCNRRSCSAEGAQEARS